MTRENDLVSKAERWGKKSFTAMFDAAGLGWLWAKIAAPWMNERMDRVESVLRSVSRRTGRIERNVGPQVGDLIGRVLPMAARARSEEKRERFAALLAQQITDPKDWDEAEEVAVLLDELGELEFAVLLAARGGSPLGFPGARSGHVAICGAFPGIYVNRLQRAVYTLEAKGLVEDVGEGRGSRRDLFVATSLGGWFLNWIKESSA